MASVERYTGMYLMLRKMIARDMQWSFTPTTCVITDLVITATAIDQVTDWLVSNTVHDYKVTTGDRALKVYFENDDDAMKFYLAWG